MHDLREFDDIVDEIRSGMSAVHYRLPTPTLPGPVTRTGPLVAAVAVVALVATLVVMEPWGPSSSAWATKPSEPTADVEDRITAACEKMVNNSGEPPISLPAPMIIDLRGTFAIAAFTFEEHIQACALDTAKLPESGDIDLEAVGLSGAAIYEGIEMWRGSPIGFGVFGTPSPSPEWGSQDITYVLGKRSPNVDRVTVVIPGLGEAEASIDGKWFIVSWPGSDQGVVVRSFDAQGGLLWEEPVGFE
jgi:hypothetical protein